MSKNKILITTAIDYTNDEIHVGHAYQKILADCLARYYRSKLGKSAVYFVTGTDEHGTTSEKAAKARGMTPQAHVDDISDRDKKQLDILAVSYDRFIRTTEPEHKKVAAEVYSKAFANGDIYKDTYNGLYCEGCEAYKTLSELTEQGQCSLHPTRQIQKTEEENYFFSWDKYTAFLTDLLGQPDFVIPEGKRKEMQAFVSQGLRPLPVTRPKYKVEWGIEVPNDANQVIYVWFDALINYYTAGLAAGFWDEDTRIVHILGKDNAKWHAVLWPAMLKSAGIHLPDTVYVHGFINLNGEKISKSKGNVIRPTELVEQFGVDAVRYYFLRYGPLVEDVNISLEHIKEVYNADLANGLGNTVARLAKLAEKSGFEFEPMGVQLAQDCFADATVWAPVEKAFRVDLALGFVWERLKRLDTHINEKAPWQISVTAELKKVLTYEITELQKIAILLTPFMPSTSEKIRKQFSSGSIKSTEPLFPRIP